MSIIDIRFDLSGIQGLTADLTQRLNDEGRRAAQLLGPAAHGHLLELANQRLHSRREMYIQGLHFQQESDETFVIVLDSKVRWIDDGLPKYDMKPGLLASPKAKTAKDGSRYMTIPFNHGPGRGPTSTTPPQQALIQTLKAEMKTRNIPWAKLENGPGGQPKQGLLHSFDIMNRPLRTSQGLGQGKGPVGQVVQGPTGIPHLQGVRVYQKPNAKGKMQRSIMTFRTVSSRMGNDRWMYPGVRGVLLIEETARWIQEQWDQIILPTLLDRALGLDLIA